jgi:hypothetical protein
MRMAAGTALASVAAGSLGLTGRAGTPGEPGAAGATGAGAVPGRGHAVPQFKLVSGSAQLLVRDGTPDWWLSPDIWVVPGTDPNGPPGSPVAGGVAYVWARVANTGTEDATGVQVKFYWGNPSVQMFYSTLNPIGTAYADIPAGDTQEVLCLVPWNVVTVNGGHECLVVVASLPDDPPLPDAVDPPGYNNVAQRNLTVVSSLWGGADFHLTVTVTAPPRQDKYIRVSSALGGELPAETLASLGLKSAKPAGEKTVEVGFSLEPITDPKEGIGEPELDVTVPAGRSVPLYVHARGLSRPAAEEYQLVQVFEKDTDQLLGGISFVVAAGEGKA